MLGVKLSEYIVSLNDKDKLSTLVHNATILSIAVFIPYYFFMGIGTMFINDSVMVTALLLVSILFKKKKYFWGKVFNLSVTTLYISVLTFFLIDYQTNTNLFFFLLIIVSLTIVDYNVNKERVVGVVFALINLVLVICSEFFHSDPVFYLSEVSIGVLSISNTIVFGVLLSVIFYFYNFSILKYQRELNKYATTDPLTGILNRREFLNQSSKKLSDPNTDNNDFSIMIFDIDHFKSINDTYGHPVGDKILIDLSTLISKAMNSNHIFARYGGEEFVVLYQNTNDSSPLQFAEKLRLHIENANFKIDDSTRINITVSIGVCACNETSTLNTQDFDHLLSQADQALYKAKSSGRNQCVVRQAS